MANNTKTKKEIGEVVEEAIEEKVVKKSEKVKVTGCDLLRVREQPTTSSKVVGKVKQGDILEVVRRISGWVVIKFEGSERFVMAQFVE